MDTAVNASDGDSIAAAAAIAKEYEALRAQEAP